MINQIDESFFLKSRVRVGIRVWGGAVCTCVCVSVTMDGQSEAWVRQSSKVMGSEVTFPVPHPNQETYWVASCMPALSLWFPVHSPTHLSLSLV